MKKKVAALGISSFEKIMTRNVFYVDKTGFITEWWHKADDVTLITRPRRFGKTLMLDTVNTFFSPDFADRSDFFEDKAVWADEELRALHGTLPVIKFSFAALKFESLDRLIKNLHREMAVLYNTHKYLLKSEILDEDSKALFASIKARKAEDDDIFEALRTLSSLMYEHFGKRVILLIDEYDTPMLEAYTCGYWDSAIPVMRRMFQVTLKDNPFIERALITGITRITKESLFSGLNNIRVVTPTTVGYYETSFGFTEREVEEGLAYYELMDQKAEVARWYDGFKFGNTSNIYNPWSINGYLGEGIFLPYWMNTSGNELAGQLIKNGRLKVKEDFIALLCDKSILTSINEWITYAELGDNAASVWSFLMTAGYLKIVTQQEDLYEMKLTNFEVKKSLASLISLWFKDVQDEYGCFIQALLDGKITEMQKQMSEVTEAVFSHFDVGAKDNPNQRTENFYHGFVIGIIASLYKTHYIRSNRESGSGRYDVCIEPHDKTQDGIILEFKVFDPSQESHLEQTAQRALTQIREKDYAADLRHRGFQKIRAYAIVFQEKKVLIAE